MIIRGILVVVVFLIVYFCAALGICAVVERTTIKPSVTIRAKMDIVSRIMDSGDIVFKFTMDNGRSFEGRTAYVSTSKNIVGELIPMSWFLSKFQNDDPVYVTIIHCTEAGLFTVTVNKDPGGDMSTDLAYQMLAVGAADLDAYCDDEPYMFSKPCVDLISAKLMARKHQQGIWDPELTTTKLQPQ